MRLLSEGFAMTVRSFLHYSPVIAKGVFIDASAVVIGRVSLAEDVSVWPLVAIRGDVREGAAKRGALRWLTGQAGSRPETAGVRISQVQCGALCEVEEPAYAGFEGDRLNWCAVGLPHEDCGDTHECVPAAPSAIHG